MIDSKKEKFIKARKKFISDEFSHLNDMQKKAVMATEGPLLLLAGAGSGKTTVLINRIANILKYGSASDSMDVPEYFEDDDADFLEQYVKNPSSQERERAQTLATLDACEPWRIIAITFTNKAANELKDRLERMLGESARDIWAMTFHSACSRILRRDIEALGYSRSFTIYDTSDSQSLMKSVMRDLNIDEKAFPVRSILSAVSKAKDGEISPEDMAAEAEKSYDVRKKTIAKAYAEYSKRLRKADACDFDDLILLTVKLLSENRDVREYYQRKFKYVLVDEYQDTNNLQYKLTSLLAGGYKNICVVGDDDQSIYKFRGATIENILSFEAQYKNSRVIRLEQNYRSTGHILDAANEVIRHNEGRKGKNLWTENGKGDKLTLYVGANDDDEAQYVAGQILAGIAQGKSFSDFAVLYRMNAQSNRLEFAMKRNGIPYRVFGGMRFFDRAEIKDMLAYLCVINNPEDDLRLTRIINSPARGIGAKTVEALRDIAVQNGISMFEAAENAGAYPEIKGSEAKLARFCELIRGMQKLGEAVSLDSFYDMLLQYTGYIRVLEEKNVPENQSKIENVNELKSSIVSYIKEAEEPSLAGFLDEIALYTDLDQMDSESGCVFMMTMHAAKGLEFPVVFVVGAEDGIFPGMKAIGEPEEMEEERRLCYVAMTRAKERLYLTAAQRRMLFGRTSSNMLSRFIDEIPEEDIDKPAPRKPAFSEFGSPVESSFERGYNSSYSHAGAFHEPNRSYTDSSRPARRTYGKPAEEFAPRKSAEQPALSFKTGDRIRHRAFGEGVITSMKPMGGDALIEIEFSSGPKRLMLKAAVKHMEHI